MTGTPTSLLAKAWAVVISLLGIVAMLAWIVSIVQRIWPWLVAIAAVTFVVTVAALVLRRSWEHGRW